MNVNDVWFMTKCMHSFTWCSGECFRGYFTLYTTAVYTLVYTHIHVYSVHAHMSHTHHTLGTLFYFVICMQTVYYPGIRLHYNFIMHTCMINTMCTQHIHQRQTQVCVCFHFPHFKINTSQLNVTPLTSSGLQLSRVQTRFRTRHMRTHVAMCNLLHPGFFLLDLLPPPLCMCSTVPHKKSHAYILPSHSFQCINYFVPQSCSCCFPSQPLHKTLLQHDASSKQVHPSHFVVGCAALPPCTGTALGQQRQRLSLTMLQSFFDKRLPAHPHVLHQYLIDVQCPCTLHIHINKFPLVPSVSNHVLLNGISQQSPPNINFSLVYTVKNTIHHIPLPGLPTRGQPPLFPFLVHGSNNLMPVPPQRFPSMPGSPHRLLIDVNVVFSQDVPQASVSRQVQRTFQWITPKYQPSHPHAIRIVQGHKRMNGVQQIVQQCINSCQP